MALDDSLVERVMTTRDPAVLVVMGGRQSALTRYREALLCFDTAAQVCRRVCRQAGWWAGRRTGWRVDGLRSGEKL